VQRGEFGDFFPGGGRSGCARPLQALKLGLPGPEASFVLLGGGFTAVQLHGAVQQLLSQVDGFGAAGRKQLGVLFEQCIVARLRRGESFPE